VRQRRAVRHERRKRKLQTTKGLVLKPYTAQQDLLHDLQAVQRLLCELLLLLPALHVSDFISPASTPNLGSIPRPGDQLKLNG